MKVNYGGCAICDSTWGDVWEVVEGERLFFCCPLCATQFRHLVDRVKESTRWDRLDSLDIEGDRRGRTCIAKRNGETRRFFVAFNPEGEVRKLNEIVDDPRENG